MSAPTPTVTPRAVAGVDGESELWHARAGETAFTNSAPFLATPLASASLPTVKSEMFWRESKGSRRAVHSWMNWVPFSADSEKRVPLLATIPRWRPWNFAKLWFCITPVRFLFLGSETG